MGPQRGQLYESVPEVLATTPGRTHLVEHRVCVGEAVPIQQKPYQVPYSQRDLVRQELDRWGDKTLYKSLGISYSPGHKEGWKCTVLCGLQEA